MYDASCRLTNYHLVIDLTDSEFHGSIIIFCLKVSIIIKHGMPLLIFHVFHQQFNNSYNSFILEIHERHG